MAGEHNERAYYFVIDRAHRGVSVAQWQSIGARNRFLIGIQIFFPLSNARDKTKKHLSLFMNLLMKSGLRD